MLSRRREIIGAALAGVIGWEVTRQVATPLAQVAVDEIRHRDYDYWFDIQSALHTDLNGDPVPMAFGRYKGSTIILAHDNIPPTIGRLMGGELNVWRFRLPSNLAVEVQDFDAGIGRLIGQATAGSEYIRAKTAPSTGAPDVLFTMNRERRFSAKVVIKEIV